MTQLLGRTALVTGGSRGIGRAIALRLAADGAAVGARGITVNAVLPGVVETDMTARMPAPMKEAAAKGSSLGRLGAPDDIADVVAFLASSDARWITGQLIVANGGTTP